jgi:hypothetical protein
MTGVGLLDGEVLVELAAELRKVPADELPIFRAELARVTREQGRGPSAAVAATLIATREMQTGADPLDVLRVFDDAVRLAGTPAESPVSIQARLAALPRGEGRNAPNTT